MELIQLDTFGDPKPNRVLVLDDDIGNVTMLGRILKEIDPTIALDWATSVDLVISRFERSMMAGSTLQYDLIITEIFLESEPTGIVFWRTCKSFLPKTPVLISSILSLDRFFSMVGRHSISPPYLQKPFTPNECKQMLESMLRHKTKSNWNVTHSKVAAVDPVSQRRMR